MELILWVIAVEILIGLAGAEYWVVKFYREVEERGYTDEVDWNYEGEIDHTSQQGDQPGKDWHEG